MESRTCYDISLLVSKRFHLSENHGKPRFGDNTSGKDSQHVSRLPGLKGILSGAQSEWQTEPTTLEVDPWEHPPLSTAVSTTPIRTGLMASPTPRQREWAP